GIPARLLAPVRERLVADGPHDRRRRRSRDPRQGIEPGSGAKLYPTAQPRASAGRPQLCQAGNAAAQARAGGGQGHGKGQGQRQGHEADARSALSRVQPRHCRRCQTGETPVKEQWRKLSAKFDALAPRERVLVFVAAIVGILLVYWALLLDPLAARQKRLTQQLAEARQNIKNADNLLRALETQADPDAIKQSYRNALRKQLAEIDRSMQGLQKGLVPPERMAKLLEEVLTKNRGLQLVSLRTLPVQRFESPGAGPAPKTDDKGTKPAPKETDRS